MIYIAFSHTKWTNGAVSCAASAYSPVDPAIPEVQILPWQVWHRSNGRPIPSGSCTWRQNDLPKST